MCVSKGAPVHPNTQNEKQKGIQEVWSFLHDHNAVFLGDPELQHELEKFLRRNKVKKGQVTPKQREYNEIIKKAVEVLP